MSEKKLKLTLIKSTSGRLESHKACAKGLGLRRINHSVEVDANNPCILGMVRKINYLLKVEQV